MVAFIPVVNVAMMFRQAISGYFDWQPMVITVAMEILFVTAGAEDRHDSRGEGGFHDG